MAMRITSSAFGDGETIPTKYTADGAGVSPPLEFAGVPPDTVGLALICNDPDAPRAGGFTHWVVYGMWPDTGGLPEGVPTAPTVAQPTLVQGLNSRGEYGYVPPSPPPGKPHRYQFRLYALAAPLDLGHSATQAELEAAMGDMILAQALLEGRYGR